MAKRNGKHRSRLHGTVFMLVLVVTAFCVLTSWEDKHGGGMLWMPNMELPTSNLLDSILDEFDPAVDEPVSAPAVVSGTLNGAKLAVHFIDVGQAESILIKGPSANVLIDAGENDRGDAVVRYLKEAGVSQLDYVIGTHPHSDHIGGMDTVIRRMTVKNVILPEVPDEIAPTTQTYADLLLAIRDKGLQITQAKPGKTCDLGDGAQLRILGPVGQYRDLNNISVVCRLGYGETSFLFTGDIESGAESDLLSQDVQLRAQVLNVAHHGSNTSSSVKFLQAVGPKIAVISCGMDNSYGHPHRETIEALEAQGARILRTDLSGTVVIESDGERLSAVSEK